MADAGVNPFASPMVKPIELPAGPPPLPSMPPSLPAGAQSGATPNPFTGLLPLDSLAPAESKETAVPSSPFLAAITGASTLPPRPAPEIVMPSSPLSAPPMTATESNPPVKELRLSFPFYQLLAQVDPASLGINAAALPFDWKSHLPLSFVKPQFMEGRVVATLAKLLEHADEPAKVGLQGINGNIEVNIPLKEIVRQLPSSELLPPSPVSGASEKPGIFSEANPFLSQAQEEARRGFVPLTEAPPVKMDPTAPVISPFRIAPVERPGAILAQSGIPEGIAPQAAAVPQNKTLESLDALKGEVSFASLITPSAPAQTQMPAQLPPRVQAPAATPVASASPVASEAGWVRFDGVGFQPAMRDLELRAVFARSEPFTRQLAVDLSAQLPGVSGCMLFSLSGGMEILSQSAANSVEIAALLRRTPRMYERIRGLAEDLGFESGETFTLRTSQGIVSFFAAGGVCLAVLQEGERSDAGFWEKLMLVARGMAALRE